MIVATCFAIWLTPAISADGLPKIGPRAGGDWKPIFQGIDSRRLDLEEPRRMKVHALRVHLKVPGIEIVTTSSNGKAPGETSGLKTSSFLRQRRCMVAINAGPYAPVHLSEGMAQDVSGLMISDGEIVSPGDGSSLPVLSVRKGNDIRITGPIVAPGGIRHAVSGFGIVLRAGKVTASGKKLHPRTAAAVSRDGRFLYLLAIDGRQKGYSEGASTRDVGELLKRLGGWHGINLDGGGTTTMVVAGANGKSRVVNRPIHGGIPGLERVAASHLGVRARPLAKEKASRR